MDEKEGIRGYHLRMTTATAIVVIIVLMSALLAFITSPPQPTVLLLGILIAVVIYYGARITGRLGFTRGGPHVEQLGFCANCEHQYCVGCNDACPQCQSVHIRPQSSSD